MLLHEIKKMLSIETNDVPKMKWEKKFKRRYINI